MKQNTTQPHTYSVGQVARRWGISPERVRQLVDAGNLAGAFSIPSAGRFGKALRIPAETVLAAEIEWTIATSLARVVKKPRSRSSCELALKHFPELAEGHFNGKAEN